MPKIKKETALEQKVKKHLKICASSCCKKTYFTTCKATATTTPSGLTYKIVKREVSNQLMSTFFSLCGLF
jgi:hypothetical protein